MSIIHHPAVTVSRFAYRYASTAAASKRSIKELVDSSVSKNSVMMFSKSWCPHSKRAKGLFESEFPGIQVKVLELDEIAEGSSIQDYLQEKTGQRTVPSIFVHQKHVGGCSDVIELQDKGKLAELVKASRI